MIKSYLASPDCLGKAFAAQKVRARSDSGFTLVEVMVALAIVALGLAAAFTAVTQATAQTSYLRDKTLATWIAMNAITELRLERQWPDLEELEGEVEFADQEWQWTAEVLETPVEQIRRVNVSVAFVDNPDNVLARVSAFLGPEGPPIIPSTSWGTGAAIPIGEGGAE